MALEKTINTPYGIDATYWRIVEITYNNFQRQARIVAFGYPSKSLRDAGKNHIASIVHVAKDNEFADFFEPLRLDNKNPIAAAYELLLNREEWIGAKNV